MLELLALLTTGAFAGWIAGILMRGGGYGLVVNIVVGVIGSVIGGRLFALLGVPDEGWMVELAMAVVGAVLLLALVNLLRRTGEE